MICHRTNGRTVQGRAPGQVMPVRVSKLEFHLTRHRDVPLSEAAYLALGYNLGAGDDDDDDDGRRPVACFIDAANNIFDGRGRMVQSADAGGGADSGGPG